MKPLKKRKAERKRTSLSDRHWTICNLTPSNLKAKTWAFVKIFRKNAIDCLNKNKKFVDASILYLV